VTGLLGLPLAPARGVVAVADQIRQQAEEQYYDPQAIHAQLEQVEELRQRGELSEEDAALWENDLIERLMARGE
jgi:hypothetical protein